MREILFRGKRTAGGEWVEGYLIQSTQCYGKADPHTFIVNNEHPQGCFGGDIYIEVNPETVGQYTGLNANGKKVFEGDIVQYGDTVHEVVFETRNDTAYFGLIYSTNETLPFGHYQDLLQIEVIGNIHDTPELVKGDSDEIRND